MPASSQGSAEAVIEEWLAKPKDWLEAGTAVAVARAGDERFEILANGPASFGKRVAKIGQVVKTGDPVAVLHADGESIPYDRPYSLARRRA
jgi:hypothetical protein